MNNQPLRVLLIEDNPGDARLLREYLDPLQFHVTHVQRLSQATQYLDAAPSDVILLDLTLPDSAGLETVQRVHAHAPSTPIVVLTGSGDEALALEAVRLGAQDYLVKGTVDSNLLTRAIRYAIERKRTEEALRESNAFNESILSTTPFAMDIVDEQGNILFMNLAMERAVGKPALDNRCWLAYKDNQQQCDNCPLHQPIEIGVTRTLESVGVLGGKTFEINHTGMIFRGKKTLLEVFHDITERKRAEDTLRALTLTDDLTGLYNRRGFLMLAEQQVRIAKRTQNAIVLLFADVDGLKKINDTWGHPEGDRALIQAAGLLKKTFREADIIARLGGDEFVAMPMETKPGAPESVTARLDANMAILNSAENGRYALSLSIGLATFDPEHPCTIEELLAQADAAMYTEKKRKRQGTTQDVR